jgi:hypothetical protein
VVAELLRDARHGQGSVEIELQPFHQVRDAQGDFLVLLHQVTAEEAFMGHLQQQGALGIAALGGGQVP